MCGVELDNFITLQLLRFIKQQWDVDVKERLISRLKKLTKHDNILWLGEKKPNPAKKKVVYLPVVVLNELRQMNPREAANILINM